MRNEILLKLYFGPEMGVEAALRHVTRFETHQRALLELFGEFEHELVEAAESEEQEVYWKITLSSGLHVVRARIAWCEETRRRLQRWQRSQAAKPPPATPKEEVP